MTRQHHLPRQLLDPNSTLPLSNNGSDISPSSQSYNSKEANFDSNMVIILAALLCALTCALGLNTIVRCAVRRRRTFSSFQNHGEDDDDVVLPQTRLSSSTSSYTSPSSLLKKKEARQMPAVIYGCPGLRIFATECHICLGEFVGGEGLRVLPKCSHGFHARCIDRWLETSSSCPTCRQQLSETISLP